MKKKKKKKTALAINSVLGILACTQTMELSWVEWMESTQAWERLSGGEELRQSSSGNLTSV